MDKIKGVIICTALLVSFGIEAQEIITKTLEIGTPNESNVVHTLSGTLLDADTKQPIIGATILDNNKGNGTASNTDGYYELELESGENDVLISFTGYVTLNYKLSIYQSSTLDLELTTATVLLDQVVIEGDSEADVIQQNISSVERLSIEELQQTSQLLGELDVLRSIQSISGVTSVGDGASGFNVRGGNSDENLILQDDALIINPTHTLGFFSLFHPDLIRGVSLYKGNQPAQYGGRLSSVLQVDLKEGDKNEMKAQGGIGLAASRLTLEGPIKKGKSSFIIGGRASYMDYILNLVKDINVKNSHTFFYDFTAKADARLSDKTKVGFSGLITSDEFQFGSDINFEYQTQTISGYINHLVSDSWNIRAMLNVGQYESSLLDINNVNSSIFSNRVKYLRGSISNLFILNQNINVSAGISANRFTIAPGILEPFGENSSTVAKTLSDQIGTSFSPFAQIEWDITPSLSLFGVMRYTQYTNLGPGQVAQYAPDQLRTNESITGIVSFDNGETIANYNGIEPRLSLNFKPTENFSVKAGYNKGFQFLNQISNTASSTPVDLWQLSGAYTEPQTSDNYSLGFFGKVFNERMDIGIEAFYRDQNGIVEYRDFPDLILNEFLERELVEGQGRAYGAELNISKKGDTKLDFNYTYSRSERKVEMTSTQRAVNGGDWFSSNYDKPHVLNFNMSRKVKEKASLSINFTYSTGRPLTAPISNFTVDNVRNIPIFSERNQFRIPSYHRLDIAYTVGPFLNKSEKLESSLTISVYNLYNRKNAYSVFFRQRPFQRLNTFRVATLGSIFPAITYNFKFK
jgi:hypothetical protein